jgi:type II secretory pathway predicted ATPase ExeA
VEHLQHFGLSQDPFSNEPDMRFYFESESHRDAQRRVERGLRQRKGLTLLTGDGGMGKTLLARRILESLEEEIFDATLLVMLPGATDATGILQRFARQLGAEEPASDRAGLLGQIYERLAIVREDGRHAVLIVDDAQIVSPAVFAELGGLLNLEYEDRRLMSMLFVGTPELDRLVQNDPSMAPRVDVRVRLQPLDMKNAKAYLEHRLAAARAKAGLIPPGAIEALHKFGRGRPRLFNTLADNALFEAYLAGRQAIEAHDVERAAGDLGIGPDPGSTYSALAVSPNSAHGFTDVASMSASGSFGNSHDLLPDLELTSAMTSDSVQGQSDTLDLDAGLEAALQDFDDSSDNDGLLLDAEPLEDEPQAAHLESDGEIGEAVFDLAEADLTPLGANDSDGLDNLFAELIEE